MSQNRKPRGRAPAEGTEPLAEPGKRVSRSGRAAGRAHKSCGTLFIIGGGEDRGDGDTLILRELCRRLGDGKLVVATVASNKPEEAWAVYEPLFRRLGARHVHHLRVDDRSEALEERRLRALAGAQAVFLTGGDQLKITSQIGDTPVYTRLREIFEAGGIIAGTSAGAAAMSETMLVGGEEGESHRVGTSQMSPGLGLLDDVVIDQHFAERGRIGRLLGVVAQNPRMLGLGIDEDTAVVVDNRRRFEVLGTGAVYVLDGRRVSHSNLTEAKAGRTMSVYDVRLHVLSQNDHFDLRSRRPKAYPAERAEERLKRPAR